jgi:hypothetical protein
MVGEGLTADFDGVSLLFGAGGEPVPVSPVQPANGRVSAARAASLENFLAGMRSPGFARDRRSTTNRPAAPAKNATPPELRDPESTVVGTRKYRR